MSHVPHLKKLLVHSLAIASSYVLMAVLQASGQIVVTEAAEILPSDGNQGENFGRAVSMSADGMVAVVGAMGEQAYSPGAAYVYRFDPAHSIWIEEAKLVAFDAAPGDLAGDTVAISGDGQVIIVGARRDDDNGSNSGSAYVYRFDGSAWNLDGKLLSSDGASGDEFGWNVGLNQVGDVAVVGSWYDDDLGDSSGSAYIFRFDGSTWTQEQKLHASDGRSGDIFSACVSMNRAGDLVIVGAPHRGNRTGAAYIFRFDGSQWNEERRLISPVPSYDRNFGIDVSLSGDGLTALIGANMGSGGGSAHVFRYLPTAGTWVHEETLIGADTGSEDLFGSGVALDGAGNSALIGSLYHDENGFNAGAAYLFRFSGSKWFERARLLASDGASEDWFGYKVALCEDASKGIVGSYTHDDNGSNSGAAYVYDLTTPCLRLKGTNLVAGETARFTITDGTPGAHAVAVWGFQIGESVISNQFGLCATYGIAGVRQRGRIIQRLDRTFDAEGRLVFNLKIPPEASGSRLLFQVAERGTCPDECMSNIVVANVR